MSESSPRLELPYIQPSQAQKHVTHNEAVQRLDSLVQMVVEATQLDTPPSGATQGAIWAVGVTPTGAWSGQAGQLAQWLDGGWVFSTAQTGWRAWDAAAGSLKVFDGTGWVTTGGTQNLDGLGVGTSWDTTNRLAVSSAAALFTHAGTDHRVTINKASAGDTSSVVYQSGFTGHAETGLTGDNNFNIRVSPDGSTFTDAVQFDATTGLMTGAAVQATTQDATEGKLMIVGAFGLGEAQSVPVIDDLDDGATPTGFYTFRGAVSVGTPPANVNAYVVMHRYNSAFALQTFTREEGSSNGIWTREWRASSWTPWTRIVRQNDIVGPVSQTAGDPTGAILEHSTSAAGNVQRMACGTLRCTTQLTLGSVTGSGSGTRASPYHTATASSWTYPETFVAAPRVSVHMWTNAAALAARAIIPVTDAPTATALGGIHGLRPSSVSSGDIVYCDIIAEGRWF